MSKHQKQEPRAEDNPRPDETSVNPNEQVMPKGTGSVGENQAAQEAQEGVSNR